ncbi:MAG: 2-hydroxyacyl-CoA dehydratase [Bacillota bacterium]
MRHGDCDMGTVLLVAKFFPYCVMRQQEPSPRVALETDYSESDTEQIKLRVEVFLEMLR